VDREIRELLTNGLIEIGGAAVPPNDPRIQGPPSLVQPASLDLTMGRIYLPEKSYSEPGGTDNPVTYYRFPPGHTAIVETRETLRIPSTVGAFGFPPTEVSTSGILMTNPGHVDPGYEGSLKFTLINMSRQDFDLREGRRIVTLLLFSVKKPDKDWAVLNPGVPKPIKGVDEGQLSRLFKDFRDIERRAEAVAQRYALRLKGVETWLALLGVLFTGYASYCAATRKVEDRLSHLEAAVDWKRLQERVDSIVRADSARRAVQVPAPQRTH